MRTKTCSKCELEKNLDTDFSRNRGSKGGRLAVCKSCRGEADLEYRSKPENQNRARDRARQHYYDNKEAKLVYIKNYQRDKKLQAIAVLGSKCKCGQDHPAALQFHHRDPSTKMFELTSKTLSAPKKFPWETILLEIEKCDLVCANCHAIAHCTWDLTGKR